jgi:CelD/BcsL family acetyltransferase involved in cellulose biosynthesis
MDSTGTESSLEDENFRSFLTEAIQYMAAKDLVWMDTIQQDGKTVGAALNMTHGKNVYYYMGGFDMEATKLAPGNVLFVHVINRAIENGYTKFDFLRGAENYKYRWGAADTELHSLEIYPKGFFGGQVAWAAESAYQTARKQLRNFRMSKKSE